ncbi:MAG: DsrE family protein [Salinirussus sp.]
MSQGVLVHITSGVSNDWKMAMRNLSTLYRDDSVATTPGMLKVVINGPAVPYLLTTAPDAAEITRMTEDGVRIVACVSSLERFGYSPEDLAEGVSTVESGVAEVVRLQQQDVTYLKLP